MKKLKLKQDGFGAVEIILIIVIVALLGVVGWFVYNRSRNKTTSVNAAATVPTTSNTTTATSKATTPAKPIDKTPEIVAAINAQINKGDYRGLTTFMAASVTVVKQSTDYDGGGLTNTAAAGVVSDYLTKSNSSLGADLPWDFTGHTDFRAKAASSSSDVIHDYVAQGHIAVSTNNWVLAYNLNGDLKISSFYMAIGGLYMQ